MAAIIKMYTWWTIRRHKKSEEQAYKLVAVARKKTVSGINGNSLHDSLEISPATDQTVRQKIKDGAVVYGIRPSGFAMNFEFSSLKKESVPGSLDAKMHGVFSLNLDNPDGLGMLLVDLPELCKKSNNEWTAEDLQSLLNEYKEKVETALRRRVLSSTVTAQELITVGDSYNFSSEQIFPSWLKVDYLHTKFTYEEANFHATSPDEAEKEKQFAKDAAAWEEEYNRKVEALERQKAEAELRRAAAIQNMDILNQEHLVELAKIESERNFFRQKHPELSEIDDMVKTYRKKTYAAYARIFFYFADHPILTPIILFAVLMGYNYAANTIIPLRVQIRIEGENNTFTIKLEDEIRKYFNQSEENSQKKWSVKTNSLLLSNVDGGLCSEELLLVRGQADDFEKELKKFIKNQRQHIRRMKSIPAHYSFFDGGLNFALKKRVYIFTVKDSEEAATQQEVVLMGANSIQSSLKELLTNKYAEGDVEERETSDNSTVFRFKLRGDSDREKLGKGIKELCTKKGVSISMTGDNPLTLDARAAQTEFVILDVSKLSPDQIRKVEGYLGGKRFRDKKTMAVPCSQNEMGDIVDTLVEKGIPGDWVTDKGKTIYVFKQVHVQKKILCIEIDGDTTDQLLTDFDKLQTEYDGFRKAGKSYTLEYTATPAGEKNARKLVQKIEKFRYLQWKAKRTRSDGATVIIYKVIERLKIDVSELSAAERSVFKKIFGGTGKGNLIKIEKKLTKESLTAYAKETGVPIYITPDYKVVKLTPQYLRVRIQGTPSQATLNCLHSLGFHMTENGYAVGYYTVEDKEAVLKALNKLPALRLVSHDKDLFIYQQRKYVQWKAPGLPKVEDQLSRMMNGHMAGYFSEDEINAIQQNFSKYEARHSINANTLTITISKAMKNYKVTIFPGLDDDYGVICSELRKLFGDELRISKLCGNPPYFWFRVRSSKDSKELQEELFEKTRCSRKSNISVQQEN